MAYFDLAVSSSRLTARPAIETSYTQHLVSLFLTLHPLKDTSDTYSIVLRVVWHDAQEHLGLEAAWLGLHSP
jgi:hypothetical protein